jgi:hypothetical protein
MLQRLSAYWVIIKINKEEIAHTIKEKHIQFIITSVPSILDKDSQSNNLLTFA